jgi:hypothetical protein
MTPKTFMLIAVGIAAEQRTIVAHSASYGFDRPQIFPAPAGAEENQLDPPKNLSPHPGLKNILTNAFPRLSPWAIAARHSVAEKMNSTFITGVEKTRIYMNQTWLTLSPIC